MSISNNDGCLAFIMVVLPILTWLGTGYLAWNWVEPDSFWGAIKFLLAWGIFGYIAQFIGGLIIAGIANNID